MIIALIILALLVAVAALLYRQAKQADQSQMSRAWTLRELPAHEQEQQRLK